MLVFIICLFIMISITILLLMRASQKPISSEQAKSRLDAYFSNLLRKGKNQSALQVRIEQGEFHYSFGSGHMTAQQNLPIESDQPFHTASIGKTFTAVVLMRMAERGELSLDDPIIQYLTPSTVDQLFVFEQIDYADRVTIRHLLGHMSGVADYFEDPVLKGEPFIKQVIADPDHFWTPDELIAFSRSYQKPVGIPGNTFHYSDTGYILLGLLIERISGLSFSDNLHNEIFEPLQMNDSYLLFYSEPKHTPKKPITDVWLNGVEISGYRSLSCDWAGGGIITTPADLMKFQKSLTNGGCIGLSSLKQMDECSNKFRTGIHYGLGMMELRFEEFFVALRGLPRLKGHSGVLATHMFSHPESNLYIVMNFGTTAALVNSFKALIQIVLLLRRLRNS